MKVLGRLEANLDHKVLDFYAAVGGTLVVMDLEEVVAFPLPESRIAALERLEESLRELLVTLTALRIHARIIGL